MTAKPWQLPTDRMPTEHEEQKDFIRWFRRKHPTVRVLAIPNGSERNKATAARLKQEGVTRGVPDLLVPEWLLWIEMKRQDGGRTAPEQKDWHAYLRSIGHTVIVPKGSVEAYRMILEFLKFPPKPPFS